MTVSVANRVIQSRNSLSALGQLALAFIDGGPEWLSWAISAPSVQYAFPDESTLLAQVQQGLHNSRYAYLPTLGLMVSPVKLLTLGAADLQTLAIAESGDSSPTTAAQVKRILADHQMLTGGDLAQAPAFLSQIGVAQSPLFQFTSFEDQAALYALSVQPLGSQAIPLTEAAQFAVTQARTVLEFVDYFKFYLSYTGRLPSDTSPDQRSSQAGAALLTLLPLLFGALDSPQVSGLVPPGEVNSAVAAWLRTGKMIGFARLSEGAQLVAQNTVFQAQTGDAARALVQTYLSGAQALLAGQKITQGLLGQDGASCLFPLRSGDQQVTLFLGPTGVITLRFYGLRPQSTPATTLDGIATPSQPPQQPAA